MPANFGLKVNGGRSVHVSRVASGQESGFRPPCHAARSNSPRPSLCTSIHLPGNARHLPYPLPYGVRYVRAVLPAIALRWWAVLGSNQWPLPCESSTSVHEHLREYTAKHRKKLCFRVTI